NQLADFVQRGVQEPEQETGVANAYSN
ncbi:SCP2 domain-containing protein, partial [Vibrio rotiferianus]